MGMLHWDSKPRVKTKGEKKQDKIDDIEYDIDKLKLNLGRYEFELKALLKPDFLKKEIKKLNKTVDSYKIKLINAKKKLNKLTRKD